VTVTALLLLALALPPSAEPGLRLEERSALDAIYVLLGQHRFSEAKDQWNRVGARIQDDLRVASSHALAPAAERELKRRVAEAWFVQGLLTARFGARDEALRLLRDADGLGFPPLDSPLMVLAADGLQELEEYALAAQAYREVLKRAPANVAARLGLGVSLYSTGQLAAARTELEEVLRRAPGTPQAHYALGAVFFEQKRFDDAKAHLERELALDPRCAACTAKLAHVAYLKGDDPLCESWLAKATALDAAQAEADLVAGMLAIRKGRYDVAIGHLSRVVERSPGYAQAQYQLGLVYQRVGNAGKARDHLEAYRRLIEEEKARTIGVRGSEG
jgi:tetratricopeptide (TPR) repeat protein